MKMSLSFISPLFHGVHQEGYWIPISREEIGYIPKSRENFSIFPIPNVPLRHPVKYLVLDGQPFLKTVTIEQLPRRTLLRYDWGLPWGCWIPISRLEIVFMFYHVMLELFVPTSCDHFISIPGTVGVSHPISRNFKTQFFDIRSKKVLNPASRKKPAGPLSSYI